MSWLDIVAVVCVVANVALLTWQVVMIRRWHRLNQVLLDLCLSAWELRRSPHLMPLLHNARLWGEH